MNGYASWSKFRQMLHRLQHRLHLHPVRIETAYDNGGYMWVSARCVVCGKLEEPFLDFSHQPPPASKFD